MVCRVSNLTLGKKNGMPSVFSKIHSAKDYCLSSVLVNYTRQPYFPKKKIFFFSAYHYCLPSVFENYTRQTYFPNKKNIFFLSILLLFAECFFDITLGKPIFQRKKIFFSQHILLFQLTCTCQACLPNNPPKTQAGGAERRLDTHLKLPFGTKFVGSKCQFLS